MPHPSVRNVRLETDALSIARWIATRALASDDMTAIVDGLCERLTAAGVPLWRCNLSMPTLHPVIEGYGFTWRPETRTVQSAWAWDNDPAMWYRSPIYHLVSTRRAQQRWRLDGNDPQREFLLLDELAAEGATDYAAYVVPFGNAETKDFENDPLPGIAASFTSDRQGGFSDAQLALIDQILPFVALTIYRLTLQSVATSTLQAYIGANPAQRVLRGEIRRGSVTRKPAVIMFADLRGFTALSDRVDGELLVRYLNEHLDCMAGPVERAGGQVLKFLGDGMIATFALPDLGHAGACRSALGAARDAVAETAALNARRREAGEPTMDLHVALHTGEVMYGNVGSASRLDFTMIGPAVNHASRIETLCEALDQAILASKSFADACGVELRSLGHHVLRGVDAPQELFALP